MVIVHRNKDLNKVACELLNVLCRAELQSQPQTVGMHASEAGLAWSSP